MKYIENVFQLIAEATFPIFVYFQFYYLDQWFFFDFRN